MVQIEQSISCVCVYMSVCLSGRFGVELTVMGVSTKLLYVERD